MPTSLGVAATNLFQFYANSSSKSIITTNQPIITTSAGSYIAEVLPVLYCFEIFPVSLFGFLNSILATIFIGILLLPLITERVNNSKDLQLLTNLTKRIYWFSNWIFDFTLCFILIALLTIIVKVCQKRNVVFFNIYFILYRSELKQIQNLMLKFVFIDRRKRQVIFL
jgi:hypothetical protein